MQRRAAGAELRTVTFSFDGTVTSVGEGTLFTVGTPFCGHYTFDPMASDSDPHDPVRGTFIRAIVDVSVRVGTGEDVVEATAESDACSRSTTACRETPTATDSSSSR